MRRYWWYNVYRYLPENFVFQGNPHASQAMARRAKQQELEVELNTRCIATIPVIRTGHTRRMVWQ